MTDVLIIDDEPAVLAALGVRLRAAGFEVATAACGQDGLVAARSHSPGVIVLDIRLPDLDGFEVCRRLKADSTLRLIPVIFLSAHVREMTAARCEETGAHGFLAKPYDPAAVIAAVEAAATSAPRAADQGVRSP